MFVWIFFVFHHCGTQNSPARPVTVYRLIGKETIEENMIRAAEKKLQLEAEVVGEESTYASLAAGAKSKKGGCYFRMCP